MTGFVGTQAQLADTFDDAAKWLAERWKKNNEEILGSALVEYAALRNAAHTIRTATIVEEPNPLHDAAPDMLAALEEVMDWIANWSPQFIADDEWDETNERALAAITKAKGTQNV